jgi:hypothetical protein
MANRDRNLHTDDRVQLLRVLAALNCQSQAQEGHTAATNFEPGVRASPTDVRRAIVDVGFW